MMLKIIFWVCFATIIYHYMLFPIFIIITSSFIKKKESPPLQYTPVLSVIVAAYNEEAVIRDKVINCLEFDYPKDKFELIVVCDGSTDKTFEIVKYFFHMSVVALHDVNRLGKSMALNRAVSHASGDIILFTDANTIIDSHGPKTLVARFSDESVGGVSGKKEITLDKKRMIISKGDKAYWNFESLLKYHEGRLGSIPTGDGEIFAIRRILYKPLDQRIVNDDLAITLEIVKQGFRVVYEPTVKSFERSSVNLKDDYNVKARMVFGSWQIFKYYGGFLRPFSSFFAFQFFSHKVLRYLMWLLLLGILISSGLIRQKSYRIFVALQFGFYCLGFCGLFLRNKKEIPALLYYPMYYSMVNLASLHGLIHFINNRSINEIWKKAER